MIIQGNSLFTQPSFSLRNRIARAAWGVVWVLLFRTSPRPLHAWRRGLLRLFGARIGQQVNIYPQVSIWAPWALHIGSKVAIGNGVTLYNMAPLTIGDNCVISQGAHLCGGTHDINSPHFQLIASPITLGNHVWICAEAFIGNGVSIADGSVIGARSVVAKSVTKPWLVWAGVPARVIGERNQASVAP